MDGSNYLKSDVSNYVKNKIKNVKTVDDLLQSETFKVFQTSDNDDYYRLFLLKKILQITINVYNNYEIFKKMCVKFHSRDEEELTLFKCYYNYNPKNDLWISRGRPEDTYVTEALYKYLLCYTSLQSRENASEDDSEGKDVKLDRCVLCNGSISDETESCDVCGETVAQMKMSSFFNRNQKNVKIEQNEDNISDNSDVDSNENNSSKDGKDNMIGNVSSNERSFPLEETNKNKFVHDSNKKYGGDARISLRSNDNLHGHKNDNDGRMNIDKREEEIKWKCCACGLLNGNEMLNCDACGRAKDNIEGSNASFNANILNNIQNDRNKIKEESKVKYRIKNQNSTNINEMSDNKSYQESAEECINDGVKVGKREEEIKWKCGACQLLNGYGMLNCEACGRAKDNIEGKNASFHENILNNLETNKNKTIEEIEKEYIVKNQMNTKNDDILDNKHYQKIAEEYNNERVNVGKRVEEIKWKCGVCQLLNGYEISNCGACGLGMVVGGLWICRGCTFANKFVDSRCEVCFNLNDHIVIMFCQTCKRNRINLQEQYCNDCKMHDNDRKEDGHWQCKYTNCGAWSKNVDMFCCKCGIWKGTPFDTLPRGAAVQRLKGGRKTAVWICAICCTINDTSKDVCSSWWLCRKTRYGKRKCPHCGGENDGKTNFCGTCKVMFTDA